MGTRKVTVYIAGPMTGYPAFNYPAFETARSQLEDLGYTVLCPTDTEKGNTTGSVREWDWYMRHALRMVLDADGIALLPGWQASKGATLERHVARELEVPVAEVGQWIDAAPTGVVAGSWPEGVPA